MGGWGGGLWGASKVQSSARTRVLPAEVYPAGKFQCHFSCGFDFRDGHDYHWWPLLQSSASY